LIGKLPETSSVIISSILPVDEDLYFDHWKKKVLNADISKLNDSLRQLATERPNVSFYDTGKYLKDPSGGLMSSLHLGDGLHLNSNGYRLWVKGLDEGITQVENIKNGI
jgi:lysophospholipase L1-like esterase